MKIHKTSANYRFFLVGFKCLPQKRKTGKMEHTLTNCVKSSAHTAEDPSAILVTPSFNFFRVADSSRSRNCFSSSVVTP